jgi:putative copper resistance protein D
MTGNARILPSVLLGTAAAVLVAVGLTQLSGARPLESLGLPDPGGLTTYGLPAVRTLTEICAVLTVGALLTAALLTFPEADGFLGLPGYRALRVASYTAGAWTVGALLMIPLTIADALGRPLASVLGFGPLVAVVPRLEVASAWLLTAVLAVVVFAGCRIALSWGMSAVLLVVAGLGLLPVASTGHSAAGGSHDMATDSLMLHVVAASLWIGGLVGLLGLAGSHETDRSHLAVAVPRFSRLALLCWLVMAASGILNALVRIPLGLVFSSGYGTLLLAKTAALLSLGVLGYLQRRRAVPAAVEGRPGALLRLGALETLIMFATVGLAVVLGRSAPPVQPGGLPSRNEVVLGYDLDGPPTLMRVLFDWRFDLILGSAAIALAALYLIGVRRLAKRGDAWARGRTAAWLAGCAVMLFATSSGIGRYAPAMFSVHMGQHMLLSMLAPILFVLGAPVTLALRSLPSAGQGGPPGPREWLLRAIHSKPARWFTHPLVVAPLFVGSYYVLYFSGLFEWALPVHAAHLLMKVHFLTTGLLFFWPLIGVDPSPRAMSPVLRLGVLFASVPFHAFFGVALMSSREVLGQYFYSGLGLAWVPDLLVDQRLGGGLAWATGEIPMLIVVVAMVAQWSRVDERAARRSDRRADRDGDADRTAYNAMLRQMAGRRSGGTASESVSAPDNVVSPIGTAIAGAEGPHSKSDVAGPEAAPHHD